MSGSPIIHTSTTRRVSLHGGPPSSVFEQPKTGGPPVPPADPATRPRSIRSAGFLHPGSRTAGASEDCLLTWATPVEDVSGVPREQAPASPTKGPSRASRIAWHGLNTDSQSGARRHWLPTGPSQAIPTAPHAGMGEGHGDTFFFFFFRSRAYVTAPTHGTPGPSLAAIARRSASSHGRGLAGSLHPGIEHRRASPFDLWTAEGSRLLHRNRHWIGGLFGGTICKALRTAAVGWGLHQSRAAGLPHRRGGGRELRVSRAVDRGWHAIATASSRTAVQCRRPDRAGPSRCPVISGRAAREKCLASGLRET